MQQKVQTGTNIYLKKNTCCHCNLIIVASKQLALQKFQCDFPIYRQTLVNENVDSDTI